MTSEDWAVVRFMSFMERQGFEFADCHGRGWLAGAPREILAKWHASEMMVTVIRVNGDKWSDVRLSD